jgi:hypothetical protein
MRDDHQVVDEVGWADRSWTSEINNDDDRGATLANIKLRQQNYNNSSFSTDDDKMRRANLHNAYQFRFNLRVPVEELYSRSYCS